MATAGEGTKFPFFSSLSVAFLLKHMPPSRRWKGALVPMSLTPFACDLAAFDRNVRPRGPDPAAGTAPSGAAGTAPSGAASTAAPVDPAAPGRVPDPQIMAGTVSTEFTYINKQYKWAERSGEDFWICEVCSAYYTLYEVADGARSYCSPRGACEIAHHAGRQAGTYVGECTRCHVIWS